MALGLPSAPHLGLAACNGLAQHHYGVMTGPRATLPRSLGPLFTVAEARLHGVGRGRLRASDVEPLFPGVYGAIDGSAIPIAERSVSSSQAAWRRDHLRRVLAFAKVMRSTQCFSGVTAAVILGLPLPPQTAADIEVGSYAPTHAPRVVGVRGRKLHPALVSTVTHRGLCVTSPPSTWVMLAAELALPDLVALGDAIVRRPRIPGTARLERQPLATLDDLRAEIDRGRRPGLAAARRALPLLSRHSASAPESHLRLRLREWGLPDPALDVDVRDASGRLLGCTEIAYPEFRVAFEYEGDHHRVSRAQWDRDIDKARDYTAAGWITVRVTARLLYATPERLRRIAEATIRSRGWGWGWDRDGAGS